MCLHVATPSAEDILTEAPYINDFEQTEYYHINGTVNFRNRLPLPLMLQEEPAYMTLANWGFLPANVSADNADSFNREYFTWNAKIENVFTSRMYKKVVTTGKALLFVNGFYEYQHRDGIKVPYYIYHAEHRPFTMGCLYTHWNDLTTFSIITTPANKLLSEIHNSKKRMPLVIPPADRERWLLTNDADEVKELGKPLQDGVLTAHTVSKNLIKEDNTHNRHIQDFVSYDDVG